MSMSHKAFAFDWRTFERELLPVLVHALSTDSGDGLVRFVDSNITHCTDPYEGEPLLPNWKDSLGTGDVQELGDYALTKYYDATDDCGLDGCK